MDETGDLESALEGDFESDPAAAPLPEKVTATQAGECFAWAGSRRGMHGSGSIRSFFGAKPWLFTGDSPTAEITPWRAVEVLSACLETDMAYGIARRPAIEAEGLARQFVDLVKGPGTRWWSNVSQSSEQSLLESWRPMTSSTFDAGVVGTSGFRIAVAWVADED